MVVRSWILSMARGAPLKNRHAFKYGRYTAEMCALRKEVRETLRAAALLLGGAHGQAPIAALCRPLPDVILCHQTSAGRAWVRRLRHRQGRS